MKRILVYFLVYIVIQLLAGTLTMYFIEATDIQLIVSGTVSNAVAIALFCLAGWCPLSPVFLRHRPWTAAYWCVMLALGMLIPLQSLEELIPAAWRTDIAADLFKSIMGNGWGYVIIGIFAPIGEEVVFRGAIQRQAVAFFRSNGMPAWAGIVFTAMLFAAVHGNPAQMPHAFLVGILMGWLCRRSGSIVPGIIVHWVNNSIAFALQSVYPQSYDMQVIEFFGGSYLRLGMAALLSLLLFLAAFLQLHRSLGKE
ncbi:MAG: CPBP family intramembrane metalloprotease [Bacteroidales bacterium]|nr:CPBP family intramembrane metalloprotease [Bacteroidales bacterium]MCM1146833.1 CPBP family intramembrane metalloprotease [Bacteroidales bacterium]MCM1205669.1 CPBP family intramembrane metalloprotease [Bacillota bacterium]MCM1510219.1 CPBP family intramembrane metalloprotease [Clostridium sp.]